jgi:hypothetical protein
MGALLPPTNTAQTIEYRAKRTDICLFFLLFRENIFFSIFFSKSLCKTQDLCYTYYVYLYVGEKACNFLESEE